MPFEEFLSISNVGCLLFSSMGTSRPALYHVLHDEIGFTSDEIEQLTYWV